MNTSDARRKRPVNRFGCKPTEDVCVEHDEPLICKDGCATGLPKGHMCSDIAAQRDWKRLHGEKRCP